MTILPDRLIAARNAKGWSQAKLAVEAGISQQTVGKLEKGTALTTKFLNRIARSLDVAPSDIDDEAPGEPSSNGQYRPPPQFMNHFDPIPVYASAEGGGGHIIVSHDEIGRAPRPQVLENVKGAYAILITGESMVPAYKPGDRAWVNPTLSPLQETDCIFYSIDDGGEAKATIKELVTWTDNAWTVKQHNPPKTFKLDRATWTTHHRVVGNFRRR